MCPEPPWAVAASCGTGGHVTGYARVTRCASCRDGIPVLESVGEEEVAYRFRLSEKIILRLGTTDFQST